MLGAIGRYVFDRNRRLRAELGGVAGHTGVGSADFVRRSRGFTEFRIELHGVAGTRATLFLDGEQVAEIDIANGQAVKEGDTRTLRRGLVALDGDDVEIRQHGDVILRGSLRKTPQIRRIAKELVESILPQK